MEFVRRDAPYLAPQADVTKIMRQVLLALVPAALAYVWYFGAGFIFNLIVAALFCVGGEALMMQARGRPIRPALADYSAIVTAVTGRIALSGKKRSCRFSCRRLRIRMPSADSAMTRDSQNGKAPAPGPPVSPFHPIGSSTAWNMK